MRVVVDTNVLVAALRTRSGASFRIVEEIDRGQVQAVISVPLMMEYEEVLKRAGVLPHVSAADVDVFLDRLMACSVEQRIFFLWRPFLCDADDDMLVEVALASGTEYIITSNIRDFAPAAALGVRAMTPRDFLPLLPGP